MEEITKKHKIKVICILLAIIMVISTIGLVFIFRDKDDPNNPDGGGSGKSLILDYVKGEKGSERVDSAQYLPDIETFIKVNDDEPDYGSSSSGKVYGSSQSENISQEDFQELIDNAAHIENYAGAGKYLGYDIYDIKNELKYVIEHVPAFNQWFQLPAMREEEGYVDIPYYEGWQYYLELELFPLKLNVTRVCNATRSAKLDFENKTFVEDNADGSSMCQFEVMKTSYFTDSNGDEVIECYVYAVGVDNVNNEIHYNHYNPNQNDYFAYEYQYLRNVKDKSLITYHITAAERASLIFNSPLFEGWTAVEKPSGDIDDGMDLRGLTPYGYMREFQVVDYDGYNQVKVLNLVQKFQSFREPTANGEITLYDGSIPFDVNSNNVALLANAIGIETEDYIDSENASECLDIFSKHIVDNFDLKKDWPEIYKGSKVDRAIVDTIKGPHYGVELPVNDAYGYVEMYPVTGNDMHITLDAEIYDITKFDISKKYSLTLALRETTTGKLIIIHKQYKNLKLYGSVGNQYYVFDSTSAFYYLDTENVLRINETGEYDLTFLITMQDGEEDVVVFDTLSTLLLRRYGGLKLNDLVDEQTGITYKYTTSGKGGRFLLNVTAVEPQE